jgi:deazaflavin-dependent oxidoreductase (nitroreductase family)
MTAAQRLERAYLRFHQWVYERSGGWIGHRMTGTRSLLLTTTGRRSGQRRTSALIYARDGDAFVLVASNHGLERPAAWQLNIEADPQVEVRVARRRFAGTARVVEASDPAFERLWAIANRGNRNRYNGYQARTRRRIPIVVVTPRPADGR